MRLVEFFQLSEQTDNPDIAALAQQIAQRYGIHLELRQARDGSVDLEGIQVANDAPPGTGTKAMEDLVRWADANGVMLTLQFGEKGYAPNPEWKKTSSQARLKKFYARFGFRPNKGRYKRFDLSMYTSMYREPKQRVTESEQNVTGWINVKTGKSFESDDSHYTIIRQHGPEMGIPHRIASDAYDSWRGPAQMAAYDNGWMRFLFWDGYDTLFTSGPVEMMATPQARAIVFKLVKRFNPDYVSLDVISANYGRVGRLSANFFAKNRTGMNQWFQKPFMHDDSPAAQQARAVGESRLDELVEFFEAIVYHGSPHEFEQFDVSFMGSGEGAQSYGWGIYFAEHPEVAQYYQQMGDRWAEWQGQKILYPWNRNPDSMPSEIAIAGTALARANGDPEEARHMMSRYMYSDFRQMPKLFGRVFKNLPELAKQIEVKSTQNFYTVEIPDEVVAGMLHWDYTLEHQPPNVQKVISSAVQEFGIQHKAGVTDGWAYYDRIGQALSKDPKQQHRAASEYLDKHGVHGLRYLDQESRDIGEGTYNIVLFNPQYAKVLKRQTPVSEGRVDELVDIQSPQFKQWFGNSKVVDQRGRPMMMFHGTSKDHPFKKLAGLSHFGTLGAASLFVRPALMRSGQAIQAGQRIYPVYLRIENPIAMIDSGTQHSAYVFVKDILDHKSSVPYMGVYGRLDDLRMEWMRDGRVNGGLDQEEIDEGQTWDGEWTEEDRIFTFIRTLKEFGHDGIRYVNVEEDAGSESWVPLDEDQILYAYAESKLTEAREGMLFHWANRDKALMAFENDVLPATWTHDMPDGRKLTGTSMSRNPNFRISKPIRLVFDEAKLAARHKIIPLDADYVFSYGASRTRTPDPEEWAAKDARVHGRTADEEFVLRDIKPLHHYLVAIQMNEVSMRPDDVEVMARMAREYAEKHGIRFERHFGLDDTMGGKIRAGSHRKLR